MKDKYGHTSDGSKIVAPTGWEILPEGSDIPGLHREYIENCGYKFPHVHHMWAEPRRCHSTMTALRACIWGFVRAYAKKCTNK